MTTEEEEKFIHYWEEKREEEAKLPVQLLKGLPIGLLFALPVFLLLFSSRFWYKRAEVVATTHLNPYVFSFAIFIIVLFMAVFYKKHQWDRKEQQFLEFKARRNSADTNTSQDQKDIDEDILKDTASDSLTKKT